MRRFSGVGGSLYALGERLSFSDLPLEVCGDGWDWRAPGDMSYWLQEPLEFRAYIRGEWISFSPVEVFHDSGRVGFPRNLSGATVLASGACITVSYVADCQSWELNQIATTSDEEHGISQATPSRILGLEAVLHGVGEIPITDVLVRLRSGGDGGFIGVGESHQVGADVQVNLEKEGVSYGLW